MANGTPEAMAGADVRFSGRMSPDRARDALPAARGPRPWRCHRTSARLSVGAQESGQACGLTSVPWEEDVALGTSWLNRRFVGICRGII